MTTSEFGHVEWGKVGLNRVHVAPDGTKTEWEFLDGYMWRHCSNGRIYDVYRCRPHQHWTLEYADYWDVKEQKYSTEVEAMFRARTIMEARKP